ncbi:hypothetical protein QW180_02485 [Vibrio sinaloensis]|nr:hypothetical protein [Vibrio sinaloensis]
MSNFADYVLANDKGDVHLHNPEMSTQQHHGEIKNGGSCPSDPNA